MIRIIAAVILIAAFTGHAAGMAALSGLKDKVADAEKTRAGDEEIVRSLDVLENYDILLNMDMLSDIEKSLPDTGKDGGKNE